MSGRINELMNEKNNIMKKNIKVMGYGLWVMVALLLSAPTQAQNNQEQLNVQFQSTSTLQGSGSVLSSQPMLNADGTAYSPAEASVSAKAPGRSAKTTLPGNPGHEGSDNTPLGDAVVPMLLCAAVFCGVFALRRKRSSLNS